MDPVARSAGLFVKSAMGWLGVAAVMFTGGCGPTRPPLGQVQGTVRYKGRPVAEGQILFEVAGARPAQGRIVDGRIVEVTSYAPGDGAPVGLARIAVFVTPPSGSYYTNSGPGAADDAAGPKRPAGGHTSMPARYHDLETSGLSHELVTGLNELTLELDD